MIIATDDLLGKRATKSDNDREVNGVTHGISDVVISETPKTKRKPVNVVAEFKKKKTKRTANFVVIGESILGAFDGDPPW